MCRKYACTSLEGGTCPFLQHRREALEKSIVNAQRQQQQHAQGDRSLDQVIADIIARHKREGSMGFSTREDAPVGVASGFGGRSKAAATAPFFTGGEHGVPQMKIEAKGLPPAGSFLLGWFNSAYLRIDAWPHHSWSGLLHVCVCLCDLQRLRSSKRLPRS